MLLLSKSRKEHPRRGFDHCWGIIQPFICRRPHGHTYEIATNGSHVHAEETSEFERPLADHETVHCGANLLALTQDNLLNGPYLLKDNISISLALAFSRVGKLDPPPPRPTFLSI